MTVTPMRMVPRPTDHRPEIRITSELHINVAESVAALGTHKDVFHRAGMLVTLLPEDVKTPYGRIQFPTISPIHKSKTKSLLTECACFIGQNKKGEDMNVVPKDDIVNAVHHDGRWRSVRRLVSVSVIPVMRPDGNVLTSIGFDPASGYYYLPLKRELIPVPDRPTQADARASLDVLIDLVCDFPFETPEDRSVWLAAVLTVVARSAIPGCTPLFAIDASTRASGKTRLVHLISILVAACEAGVMTVPKDEDEFQKKVTSILIRAEKLVLIDDVKTKLGGASLDALTTSSRWTDRILGQSQQVTLENLPVWFATGNNIQLQADLARRTIVCRLQPTEENPENRSDFKRRDLLAYAYQNRNSLVSHALTVLRAWFIADKPGELDNQWGSFEGFASIVPAVLTWLGEPNPMGRRASLDESQDTNKQTYDAVATWLNLAGPLSAKEMTSVLNKKDPTLMSPEEEGARDRLSENFPSKSRDDAFDVIAFGQLLKKWKGKPAAGGMRLLETGRKTRAGAAIWHMVPIHTQAAKPGPASPPGDELPY